jgi:hypothetical protein
MGRVCVVPKNWNVIRATPFWGRRLESLTCFWANVYVYTYRSPFNPEVFAEASQIFFRDAHVLPKLFSYE